MAEEQSKRRSSYVFRKGYQGEPLPPDAKPPRQPSADVPAKSTARRRKPK